METRSGKPFLQKKNRTTIYRKREDLDFPLHLHNAVELVLMTSGQATALYEGRRISLWEGDLFVAFPDQIHGYVDSRDSESVVFIIPVHPYLNEFRELLENKLPVEPVVRKGTWEHTQIQLLLELALADKKAGDKTAHGYALLIMAKVLPLLSLRDAPSESTSALQAVLRYLNRHYTQPLTRQEVALCVGYNESYLSHLFSDTLHTTLTDYITTLRINDAVELLTSTDLTVSRIAEDLGFGSVRSFNRAFLKRIHMTPSACRGAARQG